MSDQFYAIVATNRVTKKRSAIKWGLTKEAAEHQCANMPSTDRKHYKYFRAVKSKNNNQ